MKKQIKLLMVEDSADDSILIINEFNASGYEVIFKRVWTEESMREALVNEKWDAITCDHSMPGFDSVRALKVLLVSGLDLPFIIVSGSIGEVKAVEVMRAGANDYILKGNLERLVTATEREIREAERRQQHRRSEYNQKLLAEASAILISSLDSSVTLQKFLGLLVPRFVDCGIIDLITDEGVHSESYIINYPDHKKDEKLIETRKLFTLDFNHLNSAEIIPIIKNENSSSYQNNLFDLGFNSSLIAPLHIRGKVLGAITFLVSTKNKNFDSIDLFLAEELAQRLSMAIDNIRLYQKSLGEIHLRDDFFMIASHELKTPITSLKLKLQTLMRSFERQEKEKLSDEYILASLKFADRQITRFVKLIEALLNLASITKGKLNLEREEINLGDVIHDIAKQFTEEIGISGSTLQIEIKKKIIGQWDFLRIEQVLSNLLSNAIKYGLGQPIKIIATIEGAMALLIIEDHGLGVDKKDHKRIFERYERAVSTRNYGGLGMGLYITQQIIEAHGGSISVESELGKGSKFIVHLPLELFSLLPQKSITYLQEKH